MRGYSRRLLQLIMAACLLIALSMLTNGVWLKAKANVAQWLIAYSWEHNGATGASVRPWPWADSYTRARLRSPTHGIDLFVLDGVQGASLAFGPGWQSGSSEIGQGTVVIAGHRDTHFAFLNKLAGGDELWLMAPSQQMRRYEVTALHIVDSRDGPLWLDTQADELLLVTCYPFDAVVAGGPLRYVVQASVKDPQTFSKGVML